MSSKNSVKIEATIDLEANERLEDIRKLVAIAHGRPSDEISNGEIVESALRSFLIRIRGSDFHIEEPDDLAPSGSR